LSGFLSPDLHFHAAVVVPGKSQKFDDQFGPMGGSSVVFRKYDWLPWFGHSAAPMYHRPV
jgi:hypothetical protein